MGPSSEKTGPSSPRLMMEQGQTEAHTPHRVQASASSRWDESMDTSGSEGTLRMMLLLLAMACQRAAEPCDCPAGVEGHGVLWEEECLCLPSLAPTEDPEPATVFWVDTDSSGGGSESSPWGEPDWAQVDAALGTGHVELRFDAADTWSERLVVRREDAGPHRLVLAGRGHLRGDGGWTWSPEARATVPGILTPYDEGPVHRVTVRGFHVTGSRDKGIRWQAGDEVVVEDNLIHDNGGSPSISLEYSSRSGHASTSFSVRNNHVWDQRGECIYMGGSGGEDEPSHDLVVVEGNLVHDCRSALDTKHDGINIKDRIGEVRVQHNVVLGADWGLEVASPGLYSHNLVVDTEREGIQVNDGFGPVSDLDFQDNAVVRAGHDGFHIAPTTGEATGVSVSRLTVRESGGAGVLVGGEHSVELALDDLALLGNAVALDGWGVGGALSVGLCAVGLGDEVEERVFAGLADCEELEAEAMGSLAGQDGLLLTEDDGWLVEGWGARAP